MVFYKVNSEDPDETPYYVASHMGLRSLTMSHLWDARLKWVKLHIKYLFLAREVSYGNVCDSFA